MPKGTSTETFWSSPTNILHWSNEKDIKANVNPSYLCSYIGDIIIKIEQSRKGVQRLIDRMNNSNLKRWLNDIRRDILANRLSGFTKSLIKEPNQAPEPHNKILIDADEPRDKDGNLLIRDATTVEEYLKATEQHHGNWASDSGEEKYIHIIDEVIDIHGNTKFVVKKTRHPPTEEEMQKLYRKGRVLTDELQQHVRGAHNRETLDIFENRPKIDSNFRYPHTVDPSSDKVELKEIRKKFVKAISTGHSKARHKGFHLAIVARMSFKWVELWMSCIEFILLTRMAPRLVKEMTRCPIPKPGKPGATRPLTIANDVWTFINSLIHDDLSSAIEKAGVLEDEIIAYRRGKGAMDAMLPIISMLEECFVSGETIALSSEDEEKFFDRVGLIIQIYTMMAIGLPDDGFLELKSEDMYERKCTVVTKFGNVEITYEVGLPQGQTISVITCNTVGHAKTDQWTMEHENNPTPWNKGFYFAVCDKLDEACERVKNLLKFIYSDDATAIIAEGVKMSLIEKIQQNWRVNESSDETNADANLEELETLIQVEVDTYIQQHKDKLSKLLQTAQSILNISGDFSKVTKIGRNSGKSDVAIINVEPSLVSMIPKCFKTSEHSFEKAGPVLGDVPVCYSIRRPKDDASKEELEAYRNMIVIEKKLLGVVYGLNGDTAQTGRNGIKKAMIKIKDTPIPEAGPKVAVTIANTYIIPSTEWAILLAKYDMKNLNRLDKLIIQKLRRHFGLTKSDSAINLARPPSCFGGGLSSFVDRYICGLLREMEEACNNSGNPGVAIRSSLALTTMRTNKQERILGYTRYAKYNVITLAKLGYYIRDCEDILLTLFIEEIRKIINIECMNGMLGGIGSFEYNGSGRMTDTGIGTGNPKLTAYAHGGQIHRTYTKQRDKARRRKSSKGLEAMKTPQGWTLECKQSMGSKEQQARAFNNTLKTLNQTVNNTLKCYEWLPTDDCTSPLDDKAVWSTLDGEWELNTNSETPAWKQIEYEIMRRGSENRIKYNCDAYRSILDRMAKSKLPPCIATDGSHDGDDNSGAIVVFIYEGDGDWTTDEWTPVLARLKRLPSRVGFEEADCGTGEAVAIALAEEVLPPQLPAWILSDSRILAGAYRIMRDAIFPSNRKFIKSLSGVGKGSMIRILKDLALWSKPTMEFLKSQSSILNVYGMPKEQYRFTGENANLSYECLDEDDSDDDDEDDNVDPMTAHDILQWHRNKLDKEAQKNSVEWQSSNFLGPYYNQEEQKKKLMDLQRTLRGMISNDPNKPWHEVDTDTNPHRICVTVRSHQFHKVTRKPSGRFKELSPCKTLVQMNDMVDRVCDIIFDDDEEDDALECDAMECGEEDGEGMEVELRRPTEDLPFEIFSLRFVIFFEGRQVTKNVSKLVKKQHNNERRLKLSARDYNGLLARNEDDIDITALELGNRGGSARTMRGQGSYRLRTQRLNSQFNFLTILDTDDSVPASLLPLEQLSDDIIKKYLKEEEFHKGVYNLCPHCGVELIKRHRLMVDDLRSSYLNLNKNERAIEHNRSITDEVTLPTEVNRFDWRRSSPLHATICTMEPMIQARDLGNLLVNNAVKTLIDMAVGYAVKYRFRNGTVTLYNHMMEEFKKYECETFLGSLGSSNGKYGIRKITRPTNITIRNYEEWRELIRTSNRINDKVHDKAIALASLEKYRYPVTLGVYPPESVNPVQVYNQHPLDTCYMGWIPLKWKESISSWVELLLESNVINKNASSTIEEELLKEYKRIRLAVYLRAQLLSKCTKQIIGNEKKELFKKYVDDEALDVEKDDDEDEDWDPLLDEEIDIQSNSSSMSDDDTLTDIESDDEIELNLSDSEEEEDGNDDESEEEIETTKDTRTKCNGDRCRIARRLSLDDGGWIKNEQTVCARCKIFESDRTFVSILESNIRNNAKMKDTTKLMQLSRKMKNAKSIIGKYLMNPRINPNSNKAQPRHINYIANDLLIEYSRGRKLANIDQPLENEDISRIKRQSHQICACNINEQVSYGEEEELPQLCQECNSIMTAPERTSDLHCITCNTITDSDNNINQNGVCQACQVVWLMQNNTLQNRLTDMIRDNDDINKNPVRAAAAKMLNDNGMITDPRIVEKNSKKDRESIEHRVVQRSKSLSANASNGDENLIDHLDRIWTKELKQTEVEQPPNERLDLLDKSRPMDNQTVMRLLNIFRKEVAGYHYGVVSATFIHQLQNTNTDWKEMRKNFQTEDIDWPHLHNHVPYINQEFLLFPTALVWENSSLNGHV